MSETKEEKYLSIVSHYEECLERHGDTHLGVDWPNKQDAETRYRVMLELIQPKAPGSTATLLDFGCGASHFYEYILARGIQDISYSGLDLSEKFVELSKSKFSSNSLHGPAPTVRRIARFRLHRFEWSFYRKALSRVLSHCGTVARKGRAFPSCYCDS